MGITWGQSVLNVYKLRIYNIPSTIIFTTAMAHRTKRTYQPSKVRRARRFGFRAKSATTLARRRAKGRARLGVS